MSTARQRGWRRPRCSYGTAALLVLAVALMLGGCVNVQAGDGGFVMGGSIIVEEGETAEEDIVAVGGTIIIDGEAERDVVNIGGRLEINGEIGRDVVSVGGSIRLGPGAEIGRDVTVVAGALDRSPSAEIDGELVNVSFGPSFGGFRWSPFWGGWWGFWPFDVIGKGIQLLYWLLLALLTVALVGDRVSSASHAVSREPVRLGAIGIVGFIALCFLFLVLLILSVLIIGIPFLVALIFGWWLAYVFGAVAVFQSIGSRVMTVFGRADASQIAIVLAGALVLGILRFIPTFGAIIWTVAALVGLGSVFATRFGTNRPWLRRSVPPPPGGPQPTGGPGGGATPPPSGAPGHEPAPASGPASTAEPGTAPPSGPAEPAEPAPGYAEPAPGHADTPPDHTESSPEQDGPAPRDSHPRAGGEAGEEDRG